MDQRDVETSKQRTILIVEDDPHLADFLVELLGTEGYCPLTTSRGREALDLLDQTPVDLVLLDVGLPDTDGFAVLRSIRLAPATSLTPVILMTARANVRDKISALGVGADEYLAKPFDLEELLAHIQTLLRVRQAECELIARNAELEAAREALQNSYEQTLQALASAIDARDSYTHSHSRAVTRYALRIGRQMTLNGDDEASLARGALLHDIGKIAITDAVLRKPGPLTPEERRHVEQHPEVGYQMLPSVTFLQNALGIIRYHHERIDGAGYPCNLSGPEIPVGARVVAVADAFHAMTSRRPYRAPLTYEQARDEMMRNAGKHFDGDVVRAFTSAFDNPRRRSA